MIILLAITILMIAKWFIIIILIIAIIVIIVIIAIIVIIVLIAIIIMIINLIILIIVIFLTIFWDWPIWITRSRFITLTSYYKDLQGLRSLFGKWYLWEWTDYSE